jgi:hypothetical protein
MKYLGYYRELIWAIIGDDFDELTSSESINRIINLLTDDEWLTEDDYLALLKDAARDYARTQTYYKRLLRECNRLCDDTYMQLPRDVNGEVIHLYDELAGYGYPNGGVVCKAIVNDQMILVGRITDIYHEWLLWDACKCHRYKRPTVEDVLREFCDEGQRCCDTEDTIAEYAKKLQLKEDEE